MSPEQKAEELCYEKLRKHIESCAQCTAAQKRVNDFCGVGTILFVEWNPQPLSARELSAEESEKIIAEELAKIKRSNLN